MGIRIRIQTKWNENYSSTKVLWLIVPNEKCKIIFQMNVSNVANLSTVLQALQKAKKKARFYIGKIFVKIRSRVRIRNFLNVWSGSEINCFGSTRVKRIWFPGTGTKLIDPKSAPTQIGDCVILKTNEMFSSFLPKKRIREAGSHQGIQKPPDPEHCPVK
jgi:hypothetical protein